MYIYEFISENTMLNVVVIKFCQLKNFVKW